MARADPQLRSARSGAQRRGVVVSPGGRRRRSPHVRHAPGVNHGRGSRTPERKTLRCSFISDRRLDATVLDGFWRWTFRNSKRPQQDRAKEHEYSAHRQYIELQSKVHASHLHQSCADRKASRPSLRAKANLLLRCRRILLRDNVARDLLANVLRFGGNFFQMNGCACDYDVRCRGASGMFARVHRTKSLRLPGAAAASASTAGAWLRAA
jgi:hypothetical protein